ncbi:UNVERIFIED_CONTAM: hypothetical protein RMT77_004701 [Armadillidium vulgare]
MFGLSFKNLSPPFWREYSLISGSDTVSPLNEDVTKSNINDFSSAKFRNRKFTSCFSVELERMVCFSRSTATYLGNDEHIKKSFMGRPVRVSAPSYQIFPNHSIANDRSSRIVRARPFCSEPSIQLRFENANEICLGYTPRNKTVIKIEPLNEVESRKSSNRCEADSQCSPPVSWYRKMPRHKSFANSFVELPVEAERAYQTLRRCSKSDLPTSLVLLIAHLRRRDLLYAIRLLSPCLSSSDCALLCGLAGLPITRKSERTPSTSLSVFAASQPLTSRSSVANSSYFVIGGESSSSPSLSSSLSSLPRDDLEDYTSSPPIDITMAGGNILAEQHYDHHAYNIYSGMKSVGRGESGSLQPRLTRELAMSPDLARPKRLDMLLDMPPVTKDTCIKHAWNNEDRSLNIFVKEDDKMTFHRHPVAQSTDCIRGRVGFYQGTSLLGNYVVYEAEGNTCSSWGATAEAPLHSVGYQSLVGSNDQSWGWDLGRNKLYHNAKPGCPGVTYPSLLNNDETFVVPDKFIVVLDMEEGTLSFVVEGMYLGVAFRGLKGKKLHPIVSAVWGHCEITIRYLGGLGPEPLPLSDLCRRAIRESIGKSRLHRLQELNLPPSLISFLDYQDRRL